MDDQNLKDLEREQADNKLIGDAFQHLLDTYLSSRHRKKVDIVTKAFNFARQAHKGVRRLSGEPYIMHPIAVAQIACEEIPSSVPVNPSPSSVVALILICSFAMPRVFAIFSSICAIYGRSFGFCAITVASIFSTT